MKKKSILSALVIFGLLAFAIVLFVKSKNLALQLSQSKQIAQKMQEEIKRIGEEKNKVSEENDKLQQDALSYVSANSKLQQEKEDAEKKFQAAKILLKRNEQQLNKDKQQLMTLEKKIATQQVGVDSKLAKQKEQLESTVGLLEKTLNQERALYHYNLAVAYTQSKFYDEAINAYEKSLSYNPDNPDAHYNLGLLYANIKYEPQKAIAHYQKYLELKPNAEDRDEVEDWIDKLK